MSEFPNSSSPNSSSPVNVPISQLTPKLPAPMIKKKPITPKQPAPMIKKKPITPKQTAPTIKKKPTPGLHLTKLKIEPIRKVDKTHLTGDKSVSSAPKGMRLCKDCGKFHKSIKYVRCAACRLKNRFKNDLPKTVRCVQCHTIINDDNKVHGRESCKKCLERKPKNNTTTENKCQAIKDNGKPCHKKQINSDYNYCKEHVKNQGLAGDALIKTEQAMVDFEKYMKLLEESQLLTSYFLKSVDHPIKLLRDALIKDIKKLKSFDAEHINQIRKFYEIENYTPQHPIAFYHDLIYNPFNQPNNQPNLDPKSLIDNLDLKLEIIPRTTDTLTRDKPRVKQLNDIWEYFRIHSSSIATRRNPGRNMRILLKDNHTGKYLGIMALASDILYLGPLDKTIGWSYNEKINKKKSKYLINIVCCVGLKPGTYNYNVGKLLAMASFSQEIQEEYHRRYGHYYACVDTMSIYGKSIQYDRLSCLKFIKEGMTKGFGTDLPEEIYQQGMKYLKLMGHDLTEYNTKSSSKLRKIQVLFKELDIDLSLAFNHLNRGIYYGYTSPQSQDFLCGRLESGYVFKPIMKPFSDIVQEWKNKYAYKRFTHLIQTDRVLTELDLYQGLDRKTQLQMAVRNYKAKLEQKYGEGAFRMMARDKYKTYYWKKQYTDLYEFNRNKYATIPELTSSYLGGLFDGDGCFSIHSLKNSGYQMSIRFDQSVPEIMEILQLNFGGMIYKGRHRPNQRQQYTWRVMGTECQPILQKLLAGCILKFEQATICNEFYQLIRQNNDQEKSKLAYLNSFYNNRKPITESELDPLRVCPKDKPVPREELDLLKQMRKPYERLNMDYIVGLFDAEGCVSVKNPMTTDKTGIRLKLSQANHPDMLYQIQTKLNFGDVENSRGQKYANTRDCWCGYDQEDVAKILPEMINKSIIKKTQLMILQFYLNVYANIIDENEKKKIKTFCWNALSDEKHTNRDLDKDLMTAQNAILKYPQFENKLTTKLMLNFISKETQIFSGAKNKIINDNFEIQINDTKPAPVQDSVLPTKSVVRASRPVIDDHRKNLSISLQKTKDYTDEQKEQIIKLQNEGKNTIEISDKTGLDRNKLSLFLSGKSYEQIAIEKQHKKDEKKHLKATLTDKEFTEHVNRANARKKLKLDIQTVIEIFRHKTMTNPQGILFGATEVAKKFSSGKCEVTRHMVNNYWEGTGLKAIGPEDLINYDISYDDFIKYAEELPRILKPTFKRKTPKIV